MVKKNLVKCIFSRWRTKIAIFAFSTIIPVNHIFHPVLRQLPYICMFSGMHNPNIVAKYTSDDHNVKYPRWHKKNSDKLLLLYLLVSLPCIFD